VQPRADANKFSNELIVSVEEFHELGKMLSMPKEAKLLPGSGIGNVQTIVPRRKSDFFWCEGRPILSKRALCILRREGFEIWTGRVVIPGTDQGVDYEAWQVPVAALYDDLCLKQLTLAQCSGCGMWNLQNLRAKLSGPRRYTLKRVPPNTGLVRVEEGGETLATEHFIDVVQREKLSGIEFDDWGVYV
jgi:hypothetical protein